MTTELFPESPRVIYSNSPLTQVICQLRFPPILRIESDPPADFQDRIRTIFPLLERRAQNPGLPEGVPPEIARVLMGNLPSGPSYVFQTEDRRNTITLSPDALALSTTKYTRWEGFRKLLDPSLNALTDIYGPSFFSRIGLRYQNAIRRDALGLADRPWSELLIPAILGILAEPQFEANIQEIRKAIRAKFPQDPGGLFVQHGFGGEKARDQNVYLIDFDFYTEKTEVPHAVSILDKFHTRAGHAFRWCISPILHGSLGPQPVDITGDDRVDDTRSRTTR